MSYRVLPLVVAALALALLWGRPALAHDIEEGTVVKAGDGKLTMIEKGETKEHTHDVAADAKITLDGKAAKLEDLKKGYQVTVTEHKEKLIEVEAHSHHHEEGK